MSGRIFSVRIGSTPADSRLAQILWILYQRGLTKNLACPDVAGIPYWVRPILRIMTRTRLLALFLAFTAVLAAQEQAPVPASAEPQTRAQAIEAERKAKAAALRSRRTNQLTETVERFVSRGIGVWNSLQNGSRGLSANIGGLAVGSQIAVGPEYTLKLGDYYHPRVVWDSYTVAAGDMSFRMQTGAELPNLKHGRVFFGGDAYRYEYTRLLYFGPGGDSVQSGISDYSLRESGFEIHGGLVRRRLRAGFTGNYRAIAVGPGTDPGLRSADSVYSFADARGIGRQTDFLAGGFFVEFDGRDQAGDPHKGAFLSTRFQNINGSRRALGGFNQYNFEGQFYAPFWNRRRVVAFRAKAVLTTPHENTFVPFYLEPSLGGGDDLRGFSSFRFHDQNSVVATAEYRWTLIPVLDMALFADAGKVYHDSDQMTFDRYMSDIGFGVRARAGNTVPFRFDIGFSREGAQFWLVLDNIF